MRHRSRHHSRTSEWHGQKSKTLPKKQRGSGPRVSIRGASQPGTSRVYTARLLNRAAMETEQALNPTNIEQPTTVRFLILILILILLVIPLCQSRGTIKILTCDKGIVPALDSIAGAGASAYSNLFQSPHGLLYVAMRRSLFTAVGSKDQFVIGRSVFVRLWVKVFAVRANSLVVDAALRRPVGATHRLCLRLWKRCAEILSCASPLAAPQPT